MYDQVMLSLMTRGLPATRHVARTLDTWQRQTVAGDEAGACRVPSCMPGGHVTPQPVWPLSVRRAEGEAFVPLSYC